MNLFTARVIKIIRDIPTGQVMTYGQVAAAAGNPRSARQVVRILHSMSSKYQLPWHRIINAKGEISFTENNQKERLKEEGIIFELNGKINLKTYRWFPEETYEDV